MPNPDGMERDDLAAPAAVSESNGHHHNRRPTNAHAEDEKMTDLNQMSEGAGTQAEEVKKKYDPKDPFRPRRKKARRACYACQRAHLTCGDERPCHRCIKRGLADACQDGVRKKAKYLHDAPPEALLPVLGPNYNPNSPTSRQNGRKSSVTQDSDTAASIAGGSYASIPSATPSFPVYSTVQPPTNSLPEGMGFATQTSPVSPQFQPPRQGQLGVMGLSGMHDPMGISAIFDPSNPALFNFDLENLNFGSQYPAMEFGMLGHMSSGAEQGQNDHNLPTPTATGVNFPGLFSNNGQQYGGQPGYGGSMVPDFSAAMDAGSHNFGIQGTLQHGLPHAYAVAAQAGSVGLRSPSTENTASPQNNMFEGSPPTGHYSNAPGQNMPQTAPSHPKLRPATSKRVGQQSILARRQRDSSFIYEAVKEPYPYTNGFHNLITFLQKRFSANKTLRIAKSLASIRPSFITCTKTLNRQDLIFMEKCFQRTLFEYEDFMQHCPAPTIVCRRTGEVAAVNKEFTALTGWTKEVLLGKEPNLNTNTGAAPLGALPGRVGLATPLPKSAAAAVDTAGKPAGERRPQPVFLPELLDDDSVVEFYEDFAQLAFENSRGHVNRKCRLLKYRPQQGADATAPAHGSDGGGGGPQNRDGQSSFLSGRVRKIDGEHGIQRIEKDGKVDCSYCWVIKRDVFDIPMLIVMNFLPCYYRNEEPNQLAV